MESIPFKQVFIKRFKEQAISELTIPRVVNQGGPRMKRSDELKEENPRIMKECAIRAGSEVRELIIVNKLMKHWTLTYSDDYKDIGTDRQSVLNDYHRFTDRLSDKVENYHYVAVLEVQEKRLKTSGSRFWHIHMAVDKFIDKNTMTNVWGKGRTGLKYYPEGEKGLFQLAAYMSKYIKKDMLEYHIKGKKRYLCSKGMERAERLKMYFNESEIDQLRGRSMVHIKYAEGGSEEWLQLRDEALKDFIPEYIGA